MSAELLAAVLRRVEADLEDLPGVEDGAWRGRAADEAVLLLALLRAPDDHAPHPAGDADADHPEGVALAAHLHGMVERGVPLRPVQRFVRVAAAASFAELWHRAGPGDATALLRGSRLLARRREAAERLLLQAYQAAPAPVRSPRAMEVV
jgi:hypothetical protein